MAQIYVLYQYLVLQSTLYYHYLTKLISVICDENPLLVEITKLFKIMAKSRIKRKYVLLFFQKQIDDLFAGGKIGTARNYQSAFNSFSTFLDEKDIVFSTLTEDLVRNYDTWLQKTGIDKNSISFYMRILRSLYNKAVSQYFAKPVNPFQHVYTGIANTRKRAVSEQVIVLLQELELRSNPALEFARDIFIFSYATRGMAFVDVAFLRKQNIHEDTITYTRHKTGQKLSIHLEPCMEKIIRRYQNRAKGSPYVFPLIKSNRLLKSYSQYRTALGYYNRKLKKLGEMIGLETPLTSYASRHAWATAARNHNIPLSVISAGMGHASENTTRIYLASLENAVIDQANRDIIEMLN